MIAARAGDDVGAARRQHLGDAAPDASGRAGDNRYFSAEIEHAATIASEVLGRSEC